jgi:AraC-like DNA-binding protein
MASYEILASPDKKIIDLALDFGFSSEEAFIRAFKNYDGTIN